MSNARLLASSEVTPGEAYSVLVCGATGSCKSTYAQKHAAVLRADGVPAVAFSVSDCLRKHYPQEFQPYAESGTMLPPLVVYDALTRCVSAASAYETSNSQWYWDDSNEDESPLSTLYPHIPEVLVIDGACRAVEDARILPKLLADLGYPIRAVVWMNSEDEPLLRERILRRKPRGDENELSVSRRLALTRQVYKTASEIASAIDKDNAVYRA